MTYGVSRPCASIDSVACELENPTLLCILKDCNMVHAMHSELVVYRLYVVYTTARIMYARRIHTI